MGPKIQWTHEANDALVKILEASPILRNARVAVSELKKLKSGHPIFERFSLETFKENFLAMVKASKPSAIGQHENKRAASDGTDVDLSMASIEERPHKKRKLEQETEPRGDIEVEILDYPFLAVVYTESSLNHHRFVALVEPLRSKGECKVVCEDNTITLTKTWPDTFTLQNLATMTKSLPKSDRHQVEPTMLPSGSSSSSTGQSSSSSAPAQAALNQVEDFARYTRNLSLVNALTKKRSENGVPEHSPLCSTTVVSLPWKIRENSMTAENVNLGGDAFILIQCFSEETILKEGAKAPAVVKL